MEYLIVQVVLVPLLKSLVFWQKAEPSDLDALYPDGKLRSSGNFVQILPAIGVLV